VTTQDSLPPVEDPRDRELRDLVAAGEIDRATEDSIKYYGPELLGWLHSVLPGEADAQDAFSQFSVELWKSLRRFDGRCSLRTWCYMLVRQAASRIRNQPRRDREVLVSHIPSLVAAVNDVWSTTRRREQVAGDIYAEMRQSLDDDDQTLLVLRVDRSMPWRDIAQVLLGEEAAAADLDRHAAQLRKRFGRIKERLRELAAGRLEE
jgi:RNA polymerase sigma-70 factor (ECF subfamily)